MRDRPRLEVEHNGVHLWAELPWKCSAKKRERVAEELREMADRYSSTPEKAPVEEGKVIQFDAFARALEKQQVDLPPEAARVIENRFWELL